MILNLKSSIKVSLIFSGLSIILSCTGKESRPSEQSGSVAITDEIGMSLDSLGNAWKTRDLTTAFLWFPDTLNFNYVAADGTIMDHNGFIRMCHEIFDNNFTAEMESLDRTIKVISSELAIAYTYDKWVMANLTKPDSLFVSKIGATIIFRKVNGRWIVTHLHESYLEPEIMLVKKH